MTVGRASLSVAALLWFTASLGLAQTRPASGIAGRLTDESGAALPGVTVSITCAGSSAAVATVTDGSGLYSVTGLPPGLCTVAFELAGFVPTTHGNIQVAPQEAVVLNWQLAMEGLTEAVTVVAQAPPPHTVVVPKPRPRVHAAAVAAHDVDSVCGPGRPSAWPSAVARLAGLREGERAMYAPGDAILLDAGSANGLAVGQNFVVRRSYRPSDFLWGDTTGLTGVHSAGLVQVVEVSEGSAVVAVVYACDEFVAGDGLEAFTPTPLYVPTADGAPDFDGAARVLFGDAGKMLGAPGRLMVIDQGQLAGLEAGQRITLFRPTRLERSGVSRVGEAVVVAVHPGWSRIRIDTVHDVVFAGDLAAPHRSATTARKRVP